jgi:cytochrome c556
MSSGIRAIGIRASGERLGVAVVALVALTAAGPRSSPLQTRLVGSMHENLAAVNEIVEGVARDDYALVGDRALELKIRAERMKEMDLGAANLDAKRDSEFDRHLDAQEEAATAIADASRRRDAGDVLIGVQMLFERSCIPCHRGFRKDYVERTPRVLFMRTLLSATETMNRGLALEDYSLIAREAREITTIARIFNWSQVAESLFAISEPEERAVFRGYLGTLVDEATRVESAAFARDSSRVAEAIRGMLGDGCVRCHDRFREKK